MAPVSGEVTVLLAPLASFAGATEEGDSGLPFIFTDCLDLVDWTGRTVRLDKRGAIPEGVPPILKRLGVEAKNWIDMVRHFRRHFSGYVGPAAALEQCSRALGRNWLWGVGACRRLLGGGSYRYGWSPPACR